MAPPGARFVYSDVNFLILGRLVERVSGQTLDAFAAENLFGHGTAGCVGAHQSGHVSGPHSGSKT